MSTKGILGNYDLVIETYGKLNSDKSNTILSAPDFHGGNCYAYGVVRSSFLRLACKVSHITYLSDDDMAEKFRRELQRLAGAPDEHRFSFDVEFESCPG